MIQMNIILDTGIIPDLWLKGIICSIIKAPATHLLLKIRDLLH